MSETRATAESIRESARQVRTAYHVGRSLDGDDVLNVAYDLEDAAAEIARLDRELEEAREVLEDVRDALEVLPPGILGEVSEVVEASDGEVGVRSWTIRDELIDRISRALRSGSGTPQGEGEDEWEPMSMSMAGVAHPRLIPFRHRPSGVVAWVDQRAAALLRGEGGGE